MIKLTSQREVFAQELAKGKTQSHAYRVAYPKSVHWDEKSVWTKSCQLAKDAKVMQRIAELQEPALRKLDVTVERVLKERARMALYDMADVAGKITSPEDVAALPEDIRQAVVGWKYDKQGRFTPLLSDKNAHLTALEKHLGMYKEDNKDVAPLSIHIHL